MPFQVPVLIWIYTYELYVANNLILDELVPMLQMDSNQNNL